MTELNGGPDVDGGRRRFVKAIPAAGLAAAFAGCSGGGNNSGGSTSNGGGSTSGGGNQTTTGGGSGNALEFLHGWTGGDGAAAVKALTDLFKKQHPDMATDFRAIGGGGNVNLDSVVARRLANSNPPSSFDGWPGANLQKYDGVLMDLTDKVWKEEGFVDSMVDPAVKKCKLNGNYVTVPIGSHRLNNLFYNEHVVQKAGVDPTTFKSADDLVSALKTVQEKTDAVPMAQAMKAPWTTLQLFVEFLLSTGGLDAYTKFINGNGNKSDLTTALTKTKNVLSNYINSDASSIGFTTANQKVINGNAAFIHQGNWVVGMYKGQEGFEYKKDWGWVPFPGTNDMYVFHMDSFIAPNNNPTPAKTITWERFAGHKDAQVTFNKLKGSVSLRKDVEASKLGPYLGKMYDDLVNMPKRPPTLTHGMAVPPEQLGKCKSAIGDNFMGPFNVDATASALLSAV